MLQKTLDKSVAYILAISLAFAMTCGFTAASSYADEETDSLESQVKASADAYNAALARQEELEAKIVELDGKIAELEQLLPAQQQRSDECARALYKYEYDSSSMVLMLLESRSITDMLATLDQYTWVLEYNTQQIQQTAQMQKELRDSREQISDDKVQADAAAAEAYSSLQEAQAAREAAAARAAAAQAAEQKGVETALAASNLPEEEKAAIIAAQEESASTTSTNNVGWDSDKQAFVNEWAPRIDAYLSGSPTEGTGKYYAAAAWDNGVDPRWAPAISYVESSLGAACFRSHNAWGYGSKGFSSWEEGINTVVGALGSSMYGGYLTHEAAATYCPPTSEEWYANCAAQMAQI